MEINDFLKAKKDMEEEMAVALDKAMHKFQNLTGFVPSRIHVDIVEVTKFGSPRREWQIGKIDTTVDLE
jgi:hypothetical protein